jgi:hypothetical protein
MLTREFWFGEGGVFVRAVRTWAQTAVAAIGVGQTDLFSADIKNVLALASSAAIVSVLMSLDRGTVPPAHAPSPAHAGPAATTVEAQGFATFAAPPRGCGNSLR